MQSNDHDVAGLAKQATRPCTAHRRQPPRTRPRFDWSRARRRVPALREAHRMMVNVLRSVAGPLRSVGSRVRVAVLLWIDDASFW